MSTPQEIIEDRAPALFADTDHMNRLIAAMTPRVSTRAFRDVGYAIALLVMHVWTLENRGSGKAGSGGGGGAVISEAENGVEVRYASPKSGDSVSDGWLQSTGFGLEYINYRAGSITGLATAQSCGVY